MIGYKLTHENYVIKDGRVRFSITDTPDYPNTGAEYLVYKQWLADGGIPEPADPLSDDDLRQQFKTEREVAVSHIVVTTQAGNTFDGDEVSQGRMARAILGLQAGAADAVTWVLADNSVIQATAAELSEALALAGAEQARLWVSQ